MPVVGEYHAFFWKGRANQAQAANVHQWQYPHWQSTVTLMMAGFWLDLGPLMRWVRRCGRYLRTIWRLQPWTLSGEQMAVLDHTLAVVTGPAFPLAQAQVRTCAHLANFSRPEEWLEFGRALKSNHGQAQNVWRHYWAVRAVQQAQDIRTADAHLAVELAYHGYAATAKDTAQIVTNRAVQHIDHDKQWVRR